MRKARVKIDMVACLLVRDYWKEMVAARRHWSSCVFTDSSPQWRGKEMIVTSIELHGNPFIDPPFQLMLPLIHIGSDMLGLAGKTFALLWQCFLLVGPSWSRLLHFTERVISFTTDL